MSEGEDTAAALTTIIGALQPLNSDERRRTVSAAMIFLGEDIGSQRQRRENAGTLEIQDEADASDYPERIKKWMKEYDISSEQLDRAFHFHDGTFDIHDVPGKYKKEQTLNAYILTGLGKYLSTGERTFDDGMARQFCENIGCYDQANHASHLRNYKGPEFSGDKTKGYSFSNVGVRRGAALVKELAAGAIS
jgi:hypothetical protein